MSDRIERGWVPSLTNEDVWAAAERMQQWAKRHGECDTQGVLDTEWIELARAALGLPESKGYGE